MTTEKKRSFAVISNDDFVKVKDYKPDITNSYHTNVMYQKLLNFKNLQEAQKKRFSVDDLFKLC